MAGFVLTALYSSFVACSRISPYRCERNPRRDAVEPISLRRTAFWAGRGRWCRSGLSDGLASCTF